MFSSRARLPWWIALLVATIPTAVFAAGLLETIDQEVSSIYEKSKDAIVKIHAQRQFHIGGLSFIPSYSIGTGFFIDPDGHLLTAATVVEDADACWIDWHGRQVGARVLGRDLQTNLALLKIEPEPGAPTPFLPLGNSDELRIGSMVIAIGFPYDLPSTPVVGFIAGLDIQRGGQLFAPTHIRAECRLKPGQGGGPLLNVRGEVVGLAVAAHMDDQCCALPINAARKISADILELGRPQHIWVGLAVAERQLSLNPTQSNQWQVFIQQVCSNGPASEAGFRTGDILVSVTSNGVHRSADVLNAMFYHRVGDKVEFTVLRDGQEQKIQVVVGSRPAEEEINSPSIPETAPSLRPRGPQPTIVPVSQER